MSDWLPDEKPSGRRRRDGGGTDFTQRNAAPSVSSATHRPQSKFVEAGQYERQTITLPAEQRKLIKNLARQNGVSMLGFYRWLIDVALVAYDEGARPEAEADTVVYSGVQTRHWSSK